jgi:hypothetical protein
MAHIMHERMKRKNEEAIKKFASRTSTRKHFIKKEK